MSIRAYGILKIYIDMSPNVINIQGFGVYDVIIVDSSDPVGPAESLCKPEFYESMKEVRHHCDTFL